MQSWTITWAFSLIGLIVLNALIFAPAADAADQELGLKSADRGCVGNGTSAAPQDPEQVAQAERQGSILILNSIPFIGPVMGFTAGVVYGVLDFFGHQAGPVGGTNSTTCLSGSVNYFGGGAAMGGMALFLFGVAAVVILTGFLTAGASRGAIALVAFATVMVLALTAGLTLVFPLFAAFPGGEVAFFAYGAVGTVLVAYDGISILAGGGE